MTDVVAADRLRSFVERLERLDEDKAVIVHDMREVYAEAKGEGFNTKILRKVIARRKKGERATVEEEELITLYEAAISGQMALPLEQRSAA